MTDRYQIFISYARKDGAEFASRLFRELQSTGHAPWLDEEHLKAGMNWGKDIEQAINECDFLLAILTRAYAASEVCRAEHMRALRMGKSVIPLLVDPDANRPLQLEHLMYRDFTDVARHQESFRGLISDFEEQNYLPLPAKFQSTFVNAPPLPPGYVPRPEQMDELRHAVIGDGDRRHVALTALRGMGGVGKSVLASALCRDALVQAAFPDGAFWVTIGRKPTNLVAQMRSIGRVFGDRPENYETIETGATRMRQVLREKAALIVLDDVWDRQHVEPFLTSENQCRTLVTSRDRAIGLSLGAAEVRLGTFARKQAVQVLQEWAGYSDPAFFEIAECVGDLALALKLAGARLREGMKAVDWLARLRSSPLLAKLGSRARSPQDDLTACFDLSLEGYSPDEQNLYFALGIFPEDLRVSSQVVFRLWRQLSPSMSANECNELLDDFARMELLDIDGARAFGMHDLLHDYAFARLNENHKFIHEKLLDSYRGMQQGWWDAEDDGYFFQHAAHHFAGCCRQRQFNTLLLDFRWLYAKLKATNPAALMEDFDSVQESADHRLVQSTIRLCAHVLIRDHEQLTSQLIGRLVDEKSPSVVGLLSNAAQYAQRPYLRPIIRTLNSANGPFLRTLPGHEAGVSSVILTPNDRLAISASYDGTIKIWDWERGIELRTLIGHARQVNSIVVTPDGKRLISGSSDYRLKLWDLETGLVIRTLSKHSSPVVGVAVDGTGTQAYSASLDGRAYAWNLEDGAVLEGQETPDDDPVELVVPANRKGDLPQAPAMPFYGRAWACSVARSNLSLSRRVAVSKDGMIVIGDDPSFATAISGDGRRAVVVSWIDGLELRDLTGRTPNHIFPGHPSYVYAVTMTHDGKRAITAHDDNRLRVWDMETSKSERAVRRESRSTLLALLPASRRAISASPGGAIRIWSLRKGLALRSLLPTRDPFLCIVPSRTGLRLTLVSWKLKLIGKDRLFGLPLPGCLALCARLLVFHRPQSKYGHRMISVAAATPGGAKIVFSSNEPRWSVFNSLTGKVQPSLGQHRTSITALGVSANGRIVVSGSQDGSIKVWDLRTRKELLALGGHASGVSCVSISSNGRWAVSSGFTDHTVKVWGVPTGHLAASFTTDCAIHSCALSRSARWVAASDVSGQIHFLELEHAR